MMIAGLAALAAFGLAEPAAADVSVTPTEAKQGSGGRLTFRITNESTTAAITRIEVRIPLEARIAEAYPIAAADWAPLISLTSIDGDRSKEVATAVTWMTMPGKELKPGATAELTMAIGPLPANDRLYLDIVQTRSDGSVVTWAGAGVPAASAQHPAFELTLTPAAAVPHEEPAAEPPAEESGGSNGGRLAIILLLIAAVTLYAYLWQRRSSAHDTDDSDASASDPDASDSAASDSAASGKPTAAKATAAAKAGRKPADTEPAATAEPAPQVRRKTVVRNKVAAPRKTTAARRGGNPPAPVPGENRTAATATKSAGDI
jgi:uncharacterized protein YcnI